MKKFISLFCFLLLIAGAHATILSSVLTLGRGGVSSAVTVPTLIAGSFAPHGQTPAMPSVSTEPPRCGPELDNSGNSIWGAGCNAATGFCITPTILAPYQPCQPPLMLFPTGGTSNGTTGQIFYTSYAKFVYPAGEAVIVGDPAGNHLAIQANWNTPHSHIVAPFTPSSSNALCPASGPSVTLTLNDSASANPYAITGPNSLVYVNGISSNSGGTQYQSFGWTLGNPNGSFTVVAAGGSAGAWTITYCTGVLVTGAFLPNANGYSGVVTSPYIALAGSNCGIGGNPFACQVSFLNPHTCASSCVSSNTQFIAGQFDDLIINHHFGEQVPLSEQNGVVEPCAIDSHISGTPNLPAYVMYSELNGGALVKTGPIDDSRGTGVSGLSIPPKKVYCVQFNANAVPDGEQEISWIGCPLVGYCGRLQSTQAIDATSGASTFFKANNHALVGSTLLGVVASPDTQFPVFDWTQSTLRSINGIGSAINITSITMSAGFVTYNFTPLTIVNQFQPGSTVGISGMVAAGNQCVVTNGSTTGLVLTLNLAGTCVIPTNSTINITTLNVSGGNSLAWNGTIVKVLSGATCTTTCSITIPSLSTASFSSGGYSYRSLAGTGAALVATTYTAVPVTGGSGTGGTVNISTSAAGAVTAVARNTNGTGYLDGDVIGVNTTGFTGLSGLTGFSATVNGGVVANLNGSCVITASTTNSIKCPTSDDTSTTRVSGGQINSSGNLVCAPGGNGDEPAPFDPAGAAEIKQFFPDSFQLIAYVPSPTTCSMVSGSTGCFGAACGRLPSQQETLWVTRFEAGIDEREAFNSNMPKLETGSYFVWTNAGGTIKRKSVWVDSWNLSAVKTGCYSSATPCGDLSHALYALQATSASSAGGTPPPGNQTLTNRTGTSGNCLVFSNTTNVTGAIPFYDGEPVEFVAFDDNAGAQLSQFGLYWIVGIGTTETGDANGIALATTPSGPCINDAASGIFGGFSNVISTAWIFNDVGFDNIYEACNVSLGCTAWDPATHIGNPETYDWKVLTTAAATAPIYARSSYLNIGPDTTNGVTNHQVSNLNGIGNFFSGSTFAAQGGRIHKFADSIDNELALTPAVALGPTLPITNVTSATLATCPAPNAAHQCETMVFPPHLNPATQIADGATFQIKTATNPLYQSIIVSGVTSIDASNWNCGSVGLSLALSTLCGGNVLTSGLVGSTPTSATIINDGATGSGIYFSALTLTNAGSGQQICTIISATLTPGVSFQLNFTPGGNCAAFNSGQPVALAGIVVSGGNGVAWNGSNLIPLSVTPTSVTIATTSTASRTSGGTINAIGTFTNIPLIDVSGGGTGVTANITVGGSTHIVTAVVVNNLGSGVLGNDTFTAAAANIGGVSGFVTTAFAGKIIPTSLMVEFTPGTLTTTPCATDGIANDTHLFLTCLGSNSVTAGFPNWLGTNSTSFPLSLNGNVATGGSSTSISRNANCLYVPFTGDNITTVGSMTIQAVIPATGGNNDVAILTYASAITVSFNAYNQCDTLHFINSVFAPIGAVTDMWYDSDTIYGPSPYADLTGAHGSPNVSGALYSTNSTRENTITAFDGATYGWGGHAQNGVTGCINASLEQISNKCTHIGQTVLPFALGGSLNSDGTQWMPILGSLDANGANVQCGGVDCVSPATRTFKVATGTIPFYQSPGWVAFVICNMPTTGGPPLNTNSVDIGNTLFTSYQNNDSTPSYVTVDNTFGTSVASNCPISSHPAIVMSNGDHIDWNFNTFGQSLPTNTAVRGAWQTYNSVIQENISSPFMGTMEGWAYQGGSLFNWAIEDTNAGLSQEPVPNDFSFVTIGQSQARYQYNLILRNDSFGTYVSSSASGGYVSQWADIYFINDSGGTAQTTFPLTGLYDWFQTSFWNATNDTFQPTVGEAALGGMATNYVVFPTGTRGVDPATGLPNSASAPYYNSLLAAPWHGLLDDTGLGTQ